ncbi:MAG: DUF3574 domain-containing protein [Acetobacter sp.]|jgi:hypothetical protein
MANLSRNLVLLALLATTSCQKGTISPPLNEGCSAVHATASLQATLMFGLKRPNGSRISDVEWAAFLNREVTPRFPEGLTILEGNGQWQDRSSAAITSEPSRLIWIVTSDTPNAIQKLQEIRTAYRSLFSQQSVGLLMTRGCASF